MLWYFLCNIYCEKKHGKNLEINFQRGFFLYFLHNVYCEKKHDKNIEIDFKRDKFYGIFFITFAVRRMP